jgi:hypothetical protein
MTLSDIERTWNVAGCFLKGGRPGLSSDITTQGLHHQGPDIEEPIETSRWKDTEGLNLLRTCETSQTLKLSRHLKVRRLRTIEKASH